MPIPAWAGVSAFSRLILSYFVRFCQAIPPLDTGLNLEPVAPLSFGSLKDVDCFHAEAPEGGESARFFALSPGREAWVGM